MAGGGGDVDGGAAAGAAEHRYRVYRREIDALHVDRVDLVELGLGHLEVRLVAVGPAGVVDDDLEPLAGFAYQLHPVGALGHVALHEASADPFRHLLPHRAVIVAHHLPAFLLGAPLAAAPDT